MLISQKFEEMSVNCKDARASVSKFMLEYKTDIQKFSMGQIADATFTSKSTLVRIAKKMGYSGWNELVKKYIEECNYYASHYSHISPNQPFEKGDSAETIADKIGHVMIESTLETLELLNMEELTRATRIMARANRIALLCISMNAILAELFQRKMMQIGVYVELLKQSEQFFHAQSLKKGDVAIIISYSGNNENRAPMKYLDSLKQNEVQIIAITSAGDNLLRSKADCTLTMASREKMYSKIATFATEESISFLLNVLYASYFNLAYDSNMKYKIDNSRFVEQQRYSTLEQAIEERKNYPLLK